MILEELTKKVFGYYPSELKPQSNKLILAACDDCGKIRRILKYAYRALCKSCARKCNKNCIGYKHTEEHNANISAAQKGNTYASGYKHTEESKVRQSAALKGKKKTEETKINMSAAKKGEKHPNFGKRDKCANGYTGGKKVSKARQHAKRKQLGFIPLNSYFEGCEGHHITHTSVIYIPKRLHKSVWHNLNTGQGMKVINALALDFLTNGF